ncbi:butyrophilin subfamily 1 member A1-like [Tachyglossus aculeatus]|uniref:butyrophilin subfamily 1 member A1-like n=1 Tax=Tachyglossus aculeatus TaxID=9261 RepID=UPI0018F67B3C|nr:butyrophilin subfamily 1 member A1-like [Tachyglossus aculeatus]
MHVERSPFQPGVPTSLLQAVTEMVRFPECSGPGSLISFFIFLQLSPRSSAQLAETGPAEPIVVLVGEYADLPCYLDPEMNAEHMEVRWSRSEYFNVVHLYDEGEDQDGEQMEEYQGRTMLVRDSITDGRVILRLYNVRKSDEGQYLCFIRSPEHFSQATLELKVAAQFTVIGPDKPIVALVGEDIELPCHLVPKKSTEHMEVRWFRSKFSQAVHVYQDGQDQNREQMKEYRERTDLVRDYGHVTLRLYDIRVSDEGRYRCFFRDGRMHDEATVELQVAVEGTGPRLHVKGHTDQVLVLECESSGWYPEPELEWRDDRGRVIPSQSLRRLRAGDGLYIVAASVAVPFHFVSQMSCSVRNPLLWGRKVSAISMTEDNWLVSPTNVILSVLMVVTSLFYLIEKLNAAVFCFFCAFLPVLGLVAGLIVYFI